MTTVLRVSNAHKRFGATQALSGAEVSLERGELLLLLGPNGAGKTTLIRAVSGRIGLDQGEIELLGRKLDGKSAEVRRTLGVVPQEIALFPILTARENLEVFGRFHGLAGSGLAEQVASALEWTGLADRDREPIKGFSGGMKRRLNIACGVLHKPDVVLLDEPTVGVDPQSRERIWEMLEKLKQAGTSLVLTTHQLDEAQVHGGRIVIIDHGKTIAAGTFSQLVEETIGPNRKVTLTLDREVSGSFLDTGVAQAGKTVCIHTADVAADLPPLLARVHSSGARVEDVAVESPNLQTLFLHLTGRELRE